MKPLIVSRTKLWISYATYDSIPGFASVSRMKPISDLGCENLLPLVDRDLLSNETMFA